MDTFLSWYLVRNDLSECWQKFIYQRNIESDLLNVESYIKHNEPS